MKIPERTGKGTGPPLSLKFIVLLEPRGTTQIPCVGFRLSWETFTAKVTVQDHSHKGNVFNMRPMCMSVF